MVDERDARAGARVDRARVAATRRARRSSGAASPRIHRAGAPAFGALPPGAPAGRCASAASTLPPERPPIATGPTHYARRGSSCSRAEARDARPARRRRRGRVDGRGRADRRARRARRAAGPGPRRPLERQRPRRPRRAPVADRSRRPRRPPRDRPGDAAAVRLDLGRGRSPPTRRSRRSPPGTRSGCALWQLQPLLVHAILFGGSYGAAGRPGGRAFTPERCRSVAVRAP